MAWLLRAGGGGDGDDGPAFGHVDVFTPFDGKNVTANGRDAKTVLDHNNTRRYSKIFDLQIIDALQDKIHVQYSIPSCQILLFCFVFVHFGMIKTKKKNNNNFGGE
jgi:hypothetical protein